MRNILKLTRRLATSFALLCALAPRPCVAAQTASTPATLPATRWVRGSKLRVVDSTTGADLSNLQIVKIKDPNHNDDLHPGFLDGFEVFTGENASPFHDIPRNGHVPRLWIRAPGYAWIRTNKFDGDPAHLIYRLEPECKWNITLRNAAPENCYLRIYTTNASTSDEPDQRILNIRCGSRTHFVIDGLPAGNINLAIERETKDDLPMVLFHTWTTIEPETPKDDVLPPEPFVLEPLPEPIGDIPLLITIHAPDEFFADSLNMTIKPARRGNPSDRNAEIKLESKNFVQDADDSKVFHADAGKVPPGEYLFYDRGGHFYETRRVDGISSKSQSFIISEAADAIVHILHAKTLQAITDLAVSIHPVSMEESKSFFGNWHFAQLPGNLTCGDYRIHRASGTYALSCTSSSLRMRSMFFVSLPPGHSERTILVQRVGKVTIIFSEAGKPFTEKPSGLGVWVEASSGIEQGVTETSTGISISLDGPGSYWLHFDDFPGFKTPDDRILTIDEDNVALNIALERDAIPTESKSK
ncbi:MAG: hypothetical protein HY286_03165 [Planctomycetes bacterium]|nr:hypothetical protein [Planctomycetota bacterium]